VNWIIDDSRLSPTQVPSFCIHQINRVNSRNDFGHDDSTINIVVVIIIIIFNFFSPPAQSL